MSDADGWLSRILPTDCGFNVTIAHLMNAALQSGARTQDLAQYVLDACFDSE